MDAATYAVTYVDGRHDVFAGYYRFSELESIHEHGKLYLYDKVEVVTEPKEWAGHERPGDAPCIEIRWSQIRKVERS